MANHSHYSRTHHDADIAADLLQFLLKLAKDRFLLKLAVVAGFFYFGIQGKGPQEYVAEAGMTVAADRAKLEEDLNGGPKELAECLANNAGANRIDGYVRTEILAASVDSARNITKIDLRFMFNGGAVVFENGRVSGNVSLIGERIKGRLEGEGNFAGNVRSCLSWQPRPANLQQLVRG